MVMENKDKNENMDDVLFVADTYYPKIDGIMQFMKEVTPYLSEEFNLSFLAPDLGEKTKNEESLLSTSSWISLSGYPLMKLSFKNLFEIRDRVKDNDVVFVQGPALISILAVLFGNYYDKKTVHYMHTIMWELYENHLPKKLQSLIHPFFKKFIVWWYNQCDLLILPYKSLRDELKKEGVKSSKEVVRLGVDSEKYKPTDDKDEAKENIGINSSKKVIGYVGRISKEKNVDVLIRVCDRLKEKYNIQLLIVGSGSEKKMKELKGKEHVTLTGFQEDVTPYLKAMDIFVMPSLTETTSLATLEAMASGVPVITTKVGFLKEYVIKDHNGLHIPKGNSTTLMLQLRKMIKRGGKRKKMGKNARRIAEEFSWEKTSKGIKNAIQTKK